MNSLWINTLSSLTEALLSLHIIGQYRRPLIIVLIIRQDLLFFFFNAENHFTKHASLMKDVLTFRKVNDKTRACFISFQTTSRWSVDCPGATSSLEITHFYTNTIISVYYLSQAAYIFTIYFTVNIAHTHTLLVDTDIVGQPAPFNSL